MPQGGIDEGEDTYPAALRELARGDQHQLGREARRNAGWLRYDIPREIVGKAWKGKYRGQTQKWFALRFTGKDREINIAIRAGGHKPEFARLALGSGWRSCRR